MTDGLGELLAEHSPAVAALTRQVYAAAIARVPDPTVTVEGGDIGVGDGPGYKGLIFAITPQRDGVRLGISGGATLADPAQLLVGKGKVHRHLKLRAPADLARPEVGELMDAAMRRRLS